MSLVGDLPDTFWTTEEDWCEEKDDAPKNKVVPNEIHVLH
jgi:hypothetical protein